VVTEACAAKPTAQGSTVPAAQVVTKAYAAMPQKTKAPQAKAIGIMAVMVLQCQVSKSAFAIGTDMSRKTKQKEYAGCRLPQKDDTFLRLSTPACVTSQT